MDWTQAVFISRIKEFITSQSDAGMIVEKLQLRLSKIKKAKVDRQSVINTLNNFKNGAPPTGQYLEAYLQVIDEITGDVCEVLCRSHNSSQDYEVRQLLMKITKGRGLPVQLKGYVESNDNVLFEFTEVFYKVIQLSFKDGKDPEERLTRFRQFLELFED